MAIRKIARLGEPILRGKAARLTSEQLGSEWLTQLLSDMTETMRDADGAGLAAPQIYEPYQICMLEVNTRPNNNPRSNTPRYPYFPQIPFQVLLNPTLTPLVQTHDVLVESDSITTYEGCLSVPGLRGRVSRPRRVRVQATTPTGGSIDEVWEGVAAAIIQHEVDHLHGVLFVDRADPKTLCFQREFERFVPDTERCIDHGSAQHDQPSGSVREESP